MKKDLKKYFEEDSYEMQNKDFNCIKNRLAYKEKASRNYMKPGIITLSSFLIVIFSLIIFQGIKNPFLPNQSSSILPFLNSCPSNADASDFNIDLVLYRGAKQILNKNANHKNLTKKSKEVMAEYQMDYVRISNPLKFDIMLENVAHIEKIIGSGLIEVIVADIELFEGTSTNQNAISEKIILFKSDIGVYSCLTNGGSFLNQEAIYNFSDHKQLEGLSVVKYDFSNIMIYLYMNNGIPGFISFNEDIGFHGQPEPNYDKIEKFLPLEGSYLKSDEIQLFEIEALMQLNLIQLDVVIENVLNDGNNYSIQIIKIANRNLTTIERISPNDIYRDDEVTKGNIEDLISGMEITVFYVEYYENYNPVIIKANKIIYPGNYSTIN